MAIVSKSELIKLQKQLGTDEAIGKKFKVTRQAIHQLRKKYGVQSRLIDNIERNEKLLALYNKGTPVASIAKKFKLSVSQTYIIIKSSGKGKKSAAKKKKK